MNIYGNIMALNWNLNGSKPKPLKQQILIGPSCSNKVE